MKKHPIALIIAALIMTSCGGGKSSSSLISSSSSESSSSSSSSSSSLPPKTYTVTWKNEDGTILETDYEVLEGTDPSYDGDEPRKANDAQYNYTFLEWTPALGPVNYDVEYVATYHEELRKYTVVWKDENGDVLETDENVPYGTTPEFNGEEPTKEMTVETVYSFDDWEPKVDKIEGDIVYTATYKDEPRKYTITWKNYDDELIKTDEVAFGTLPEYEGEEPTKESTAQFAYTFNGWSPNVKEVDGEATYYATYTEETRGYTVTWLNDDGTVLKVDKDVLYGTTPSFGEENPVKENRRGVTYTFDSWTPEIVPVEGDQTYTATYTYEATFLFDLIDYEMEEGHDKSELQGSPWVNVNYEDQIYKIKKPSLKDDFYTAINYDDIKNKVPGPFDDSTRMVYAAIDKIFNGEAETTNGDIIIALMDKVKNGDAEAVTNYLNNLDLETYFSSSAVFSSPSSYLYLSPLEEGYEVSFNDGYHVGPIGLHTLYFYAEYYYQYRQSAQSITNKLSEVYNLGFDSKAIEDVMAFEGDTIDGLFRNYGDRTSTYTVDTLPWEQMKSALLDLGVSNEETIVVRNCNRVVFNDIYNDYIVNNQELLKNALLTRLAFDYRFLMGFDSYRELNTYITQSQLFEDENYLSNLPDRELSKRLAGLMIPYIVEQSYLELEGSPETKARVAELIESVLEAYPSIVDSASWLSDTGKRSIKNKLAKMKYESCYPDGYLYYPTLDQSTLETDSLVDVFNSYLNGVVDITVKQGLAVPSVWEYMTTYTINAFYSPTDNAFVILNGIVGGMLGNSVEELYGTLGYVIGHEISHAFDSSGIQFDANGNMSGILTFADQRAFTNRVNKLIAFYKNITLFGDTKVDGDNVNGEATADMGGVRVMLELAKDIPDFDYDLFFRSIARTWIEQPYHGQAAVTRAANTHPFEYLRTNVTLAQFDKFFETYDIGPGDGMYLPKEERIAIW